MKGKIAVIMSTYNGEKYIKEQLNSILNQKFTNCSLELFIRDDKSSDNTVDIIKKYQDNYDNINFINECENINYGCTKSFFKCLEYVYNKFKEDFDYYCFADQDDFWLENKLDTAVQKISKSNSGSKGCLYFSNKTIVDENLNIIREEKIDYYDNFIECAFTSNAFGCTMVFDKFFVEILLKGLPEIKVYHDAWVYRLAKSINCTIVFDKDSYILYRQHSNNVVGAFKEKNFNYYIQQLFPTMFGKRDHYLQNFFIELEKKYGSQIKESKNYNVIMQIITYNKSLINSLKLINNKEVKKMRIKSIYKMDLQSGFSSIIKAIIKK